MITSFFKKRSSATASKVGDGLDPPSKKKKQDNKKRNKEYGYSAANISEVIEKMKDSEAGKWRLGNTETVCLHPLASCQPCFLCPPTQETLFGIH